ncbi:hypothetical protein Syun_031619 [Stephania yunnanensis]|uniref:Transmembrane protein n=1 Tax=Stephania yunnanensis TaxID=152371 RepID=A0AAP0HGS4_9MAGN
MAKWEPMLCEKQLSTSTCPLIITSNNNLIFGLTPPTVAMAALAILLCIFIEFSRRNPRCNRPEKASTDRKPPPVETNNNKHQHQHQHNHHMKMWKQRGWPILNQLLIFQGIFHSRLLSGVLSLEGEIRRM